MPKVESLNVGQNWVEEAWQGVVRKTTRANSAIGAGFVHASRSGKYDRILPHGWTAGFWPGILWLVYRENKDENLRETAEKCEQKLDEAIDRFVHLHHDVGFIWQLTSVANYKMNGNPLSKVRAHKVASWLAGRFNVRGKFIRAWNEDSGIGTRDNAGLAIVDCTMNLSLLLWASAETKDPRYRHIAAGHADTVLRHFVREDGSCRHIVAFDPDTGEMLEALAGQGYAPDSAWARGAAWALYGLALCYRYTKNEAYLQGSRQVADFFLDNLPDDGVPYWDFRIPDLERAPKDSSAAAVAAGGLLLLAELTDENPAGGSSSNASHHYKDQARRILKSLSEHYAVWDDRDEAILLHGTGNFPAAKNIGAGLIYGDYFFIEALAKLRGQKETFW
ncbi:glycoside hydrolase family 88 protein [Paenibacillus lutrae]|uniref:Glycosyl hydrolase n=1 Tax=Paenibacillus lutrae TaxID=2078573 RepID=A0A7X3FEV2_9BACL|nr:glycoside hydrolase family 88 protein [Paenibacillus lutrae]MVO98408.1 glycosyl hydrolase [Paenibacillus lutrae]